ncbi:hypothetical protein TrST_g13023 [Triparma strigata]|uniref:Uncharacterized protein n=2 Tax=Triparma TaxID=722752 RepID=A0A9W6ZQY0_9STRA|nr:hypothetical protein TrST_g13023 [Triparma strigata]
MERLENDSPDDSYSHFYDWSDYSTNLFKAAFNAQTVGEHVGRTLTSPPSSLHIIGISVGSFAADSCLKTLRTLHPTSTLQLTLLDPFTQRGVLGVGYGVKYFGREADYAQQFLNTDDPVPSTNEACKECAVFDVTGAREREEEIFGHDWPLVYFSRYWGDVGIVEEARRIGRGEVIKVP